MWYIGNIPIVEANHSIIATGFTFSILAFLTISTRIYTRAVLVKNLGVDDFLIVVAFLGSLSYLTASIEQMKYGLGSPGYPTDPPRFLQSLFATIISYNVTQMTIKFSILFQYRRIFQTQWAKRLLRLILVYFIAYGLQCVSMSILMCVPVRRYWDQADEGTCIDQFLLHFIQAAFNTFNDTILLIFPIPFLRKLNVNRRVKAILIGVFACGAFTCIIAGIRLHSIWLVHFKVAMDEQNIKSGDITLWSCLEINVSMICASVPALKAFFARYLPRFLRTSRLDISGPSGNQDRHDNYQRHQDWHDHFKPTKPNPDNSDIESSASQANLNKILVTVTVPDLLDDADAGLGCRLTDDIRLGRMSPGGERATGATTGKMEIMVQRTFETLAIETPREAARSEKNGDLFPGY
ncbi:Satratoxin biosynthesis SC1 cluster protein 4 [Rhypophila decipiens]|uniref:Satratoxin biosynthesis SC1 cluster protein 4 n=1 Tax=Rhypophila decipiens TaxID=261697 RepID=A0AAN6XYY1_9PEZI|nr:Satratoxin biosynthesis SC1 cluster protein 4 [Rhypophila decipiens]